MNIEKLTIQNFRNFEGPKTFQLNPHFTAFIGVNGKGKSTILHALRIAAGAFLLYIPDVKKRHIWRDEIRCVSGPQGSLLDRYPVNVEAVGRFPDMTGSITWRRRWLEGSSSATSSNNDVGNIRDIGWAKYDRVNNKLDDKTDLPVIGFFGIERAVGAGRVTQKSRRQVGKRIFKDGYQDWESMVAVKFHYREWLGTYNALLAHQKEYEGTKDAFYACIRTANPFISQIEFIEGTLWLKVKVENHESDFLPINLHSDGVHYFTEMVAEIAYRCIVLNGYKKENAIKESSGIIMIDELDLHLHPTWQRHVVNDLKNAFPNIQFVVTTHSPFIVQSLKSDEVWNLDKDMDVAPDALKIDTVATEIMGVSSAFAESNEQKYNQAKTILTDIEQGKSEAEIDQNLNEISDPTMRALLELQKMSKGK